MHSRGGREPVAKTSHQRADAAIQSRKPAHAAPLARRHCTLTAHAIIVSALHTCYGCAPRVRLWHVQLDLY